METMEERLGGPLLMTYRAVGSGTGQKEFLASKNAFGGSEIPLSQTQASTFGKEVLHIPHVLGAIAFFHSVPASVTGDKSVRLTPTLLAKIFQRDITTWDHPDILAVNPGLTFPAGQAISVYHRKLGSSSTSLISQYFDAVVGSDVWKLGVNKLLNWPEGTIAAEGSDGVSKGVSGQPYSIGYVDANHGHRLGLSEIALQNKDGNFLVSSDADIGGAATNANLPASHESWADVSLLNQAGARTWPIVSFSYMLVRSDMTADGAVGALVKAYLKFAVDSADGRGMVKDFGFDPIPQKVVDLNKAGISRIKLGAGVEEFTFETSTDPINGAGDHVFSVKRRQYSAYESEHNSRLIATLQQQVSELATQVNAGSSQSGSILELHASGTTNPSKLHWKYMETMEERLGGPLLMTYRAVGSGTGQKEFLASKNAFGGSEIPLSQTQASTFGKEVLHIPHVLGAIAFFHSVPASVTGDKSVRLTPTLLAKIFQRDITTWDHPDILAVNPGLTFPAGQAISVYHRKLGSSSTSLISQYFDAVVGSDVWKLGVNKLLNWPEGTIAAEGSDGVSKGVSGQPYSIGYVDANHGHRLGLSEIALQNKDGNFLVSSDADIGGAATNANLPASHESWADVSLLNQAGARTWPIVSFSYMLVRSDMTADGAVGALVKAYLKFAVDSADGRGMVKDFGFDPIPQKVVDLNKAGISRIKLGAGVEEFTFETSTDPINGAGDHVFSVKRRQYSAYESEHNSRLIEAQARSIADLEISVSKANHAAQITALEQKISAISKEEKEDEDDDNSPSGVAIAGLLVSVVAVALSSFTLYSVKMQPKHTQLATSDVAAEEISLTDV